MSSVDEGMLDLGIHISEPDALERALHHPKIRARQLGRAGLSEACLACPVLDVCEGAYFAHRYAKGSNPEVTDPGLKDFKNPSVYCGDLFQLINHVSMRLSKAVVPGKLPKRIVRGQNVRHIAARAERGFITATQAVELAAAQGALAVSGSIYPSNVLFVNNLTKGPDGFSLLPNGWKPISIEGDDTTKITARAGVVGETAVWGVLAGYLSGPERFNEDLLPGDAVYDRGLLAWTFNQQAGRYALSAHPDVLASTRLIGLKPETIIGECRFTQEQHDFGQIRFEPGHFGSDTDIKTVATLPVRIADVLPLLRLASPDYMRYKPLRRSKID